MQRLTKYIHSNKLLLSLVLGLFILFFVGGPSYYSRLSFYYFWNLGHIIFFALSSYLIINFLNEYKRLTCIVITLIFTIVLGSIIELIQSELGRTIDWQDMYRNLLGTGFTTALLLFSHKKSIIKKIFLTLIISLILIDQNELFYAIDSEVKAWLNLPVLADFEKEFEVKQWSGQSLTQSSEKKLTGLHSMKVKLFSGQKYSGFTFKHFPANWSNYQQLTFALFNPYKTAIKLTIKITDFEHDLSINKYNYRFNRQLKLQNGWNQIIIPLKEIIESPKKRKLDISDISQVGFFMINLKKDQVIYIDNMRLL